MNDRAFYALLHGALRMIYFSVFFYIWRKSKRGGIPGSHNLLGLGQRIPWIVLWTTLCYIAGELIKIGEDMIIPYHQGPQRPLTLEEWEWRTAAAIAYMAGLPGLLIAFMQAKRTYRKV